MTIFGILDLVCGLALFLYGMEIMGDALEKQAGGKFKRVLERITSNPLSGIALGTGITAIIQSSSATTVMVVGLVNSGIMTLENTVGVIMGANIGTTITAWLISLTSIQSDNFFLQIAKPSSFTPVLAAIGICFIMFTKSERKRTAANIMLGFTVLIVGMNMMTGAVKPLGEIPEFRQVLLFFTNPLLGVLTGMIFTAVIQSSSASVGILQAMSITGGLSYRMAIPIIFGQNIGTCVTALISSLGTNTNAKRAAMLHLIFNIVGAAAFLALFVAANALFTIHIMDSAVNPATIAIVHTLFNVGNTILSLPFRNQLIALARSSIKDVGEDERFNLLDDRFLSTPSFAIDQCKSMSEEMARLARGNLNDAIDILNEYSEETAKRLNAAEEDIDTYEDKLGAYLIKVAGSSLSLNDSHRVTNIMHCIGDFERIGDHAVNIAQSADEMLMKGLDFSAAAKADIRVMGGAVREIVDMTISAFTADDASLAAQIEPLEEVVDILKIQLKDRHIARLQRGECTTVLGITFSDLINDFERVADHCSNIAISIIQEKSGDSSAHDYLNKLKISESEVLSGYYNTYLEKYKLSV